jgi:hypothetical protein
VHILKNNFLFGKFLNMTHEIPIKQTEVDYHWNSKGVLPPVNIPLLVIIDGMQFKVIRKEYLKVSTGNMTYVSLEQAPGEIHVFQGRFPWKYL